MSDVVDARGLRCPVPVLRLRDRLAALPAGTVVELLADDPLVTLDVPAFCAQEGHDDLGAVKDPAGYWRLTVRRGATARGA